MAARKKENEALVKIPAKEGKISKPKKATEEDTELQNTLKDFINGNMPDMMADFQALSPTKKWDVMIQLLPYATPKMQPTDVNVNIGMEPLLSQLGQLAKGTTRD